MATPAQTRGRGRRQPARKIKSTNPAEADGVGTTDLKTGAATHIYDATGLTFDIVSSYRWTLTKKNGLSEVPYVYLIEYAVDESTIKTQLSYYSTGVTNAVANVAADATAAIGAEGLADGGSTDFLAPYEKLFPRKETGNVYKLPYFDDVNFELNTPMWASLDTLEQGAKAAESVGGILFGDKGAEFVKQFIGGSASLAGAALAAVYPKVGIMDRPKLWQSHDYRTINVKFPLFNTYDPNDWQKNREFCWVFVNQNLFTKRDFITGIPPVYYEVIIPGQHYSYAACVTNVTIYNRGNMRNLTDKNGNDAVVPDVYEVNITLTDMVMPSRNLFQSIQTKGKDVTSKLATTQVGAPTDPSTGVANTSTPVQERRQLPRQNRRPARVT